MVRRRTGRGERGVVAVIVAITLVVLMTVAALAVDLGRAIYARNSLQIAVDGAMKAAAAAALTQPTTYTTEQKTSEMTRIARAYFTSNNRLDPRLAELLGDLDVQYITSGPNEDSVVGTQKAKVPMSFARIINVDEIPLTVSAMVKRPSFMPLELVMALDVSPSMAGPFGNSTKIDALKSSAKELVSLLMQSDYAKVGLVPFGWLIKIYDPRPYYDYVSKTSKVKWLAFGEQTPIQYCNDTDSSNSKCSSYLATCTTDGVPYICEKWDCSGVVCTDWRWHTPDTWYGCLYLRPSRGRTTINRSSPTSEPYYGVLSDRDNDICAKVPGIQDLVTKGKTYRYGSYLKNFSAEEYLRFVLDNGITTDNSEDTGTYIPGALIWAWNMLTTETRGDSVDPDYPLNSGFTAAEVAELGVRKALVLITDGNNSFYPKSGGPTAGGADTLGQIQDPANSVTEQIALTDEVNTDMVTICNNMKSQNIKIYVIALQFSAADLAYKSILRDKCASSPDTFFDVSNPPELVKAFQNIGAGFAYNSLKQ